MSAWDRLNKKIQTMAGSPKTTLSKKFSKSELYDVTRDPEDWITDLELFIGYLQTLVVIIEDT